MKLNLNNTVIEVLNLEHGKKVKEFWIRNGGNEVWNYTNNKHDNYVARFYGFVDGKFSCYSKDYLLPRTRISTLEALELEEKGEAREIDYYLVKKECWGVDGTLWTKANILATDNSISLPYFQEIGLLSNPDYFTPVYKEVNPKFKVGDYCKKEWKDGDLDYFDAAQVTEEGIKASEYYRIHNGTIEDVSKYSNNREDARFNDERCTLSVIPKSEFDEVKQLYLAAEKIMIGGKYEVKLEPKYILINGLCYSKAEIHSTFKLLALGATQEQIEKIISKLK